MPLFYDQMNRAVELQQAPKRIISLVPSQTELLFDLGLADSIAGVTKFCIHPADQVKQMPKVGGTKQLNMDLIHSLNPGLIIANKEENEQQQIEELMKSYPVWLSDISDLEAALEMIKAIGGINDKLPQSTLIAKNIANSFGTLKPLSEPLSCIYLIWRRPYMAAGSGTFINDMLARCGFDNIIDDDRYPSLTMEQLTELNPQIVLLSSEPYPFAEKHIAELKTLLPNSVVVLVDGELFSWYGSRLLYSAAYFSTLIEKLLPNNEADTAK